MQNSPRTEFFVPPSSCYGSLCFFFFFAAFGCGSCLNSSESPRAAHHSAVLLGRDLRCGGGRPYEDFPGISSGECEELVGTEGCRLSCHFQDTRVCCCTACAGVKARLRLIVSFCRKLVRVCGGDLSLWLPQCTVLSRRGAVQQWPRFEVASHVKSLSARALPLSFVFSCVLRVKY